MVNLEPLISKNLAYSSFVQKFIKQQPPDELFPTITVSRDPGSGGKDVAKHLAEKLKVKFFDEELVDMIAKEGNLKKKMVRALDKKTHSTVEDLIKSFLGMSTLPDTTFIKNFARVVLSIAAHQPAIILGRGANFVLPYDRTLRVRITAPRQILLKYTMQFEGHNRNKAREIIDQYSEERKDFVYKYFSKDLLKAHYYDVVINTEFFTIEDAVEIAMKAFERKFGKK